MAEESLFEEDVRELERKLALPPEEFERYANSLLEAGVKGRSTRARR
jgi:hypothetical protein